MFKHDNWRYLKDEGKSNFRGVIYILYINYLAKATILSGSSGIDILYGCHLLETMCYLFPVTISYEKECQWYTNTMLNVKS